MVRSVTPCRPEADLRQVIGACPTRWPPAKDIGTPRRATAAPTSRTPRSCWSPRPAATTSLRRLAQGGRPGVRPGPRRAPAADPRSPGQPAAGRHEQPAAQPAHRPHPPDPGDGGDAARERPRLHRARSGAARAVRDARQGPHARHRCGGRGRRSSHCAKALQALGDVGAGALARPQGHAPRRRRCCSITRIRRA